uniref:Uncharacterized protein n=1 Tax=Lygus hesperus TaxID=30085 RepID=A0A0K8SE67_LYGHE
MAEEGREKPTFMELTEELKKLRENDSQRETRIKKLTNDTRKTQERLKMLELQIHNFQSNVVNNEISNEEQIGCVNEQFVKSFIELTCECVVINKRMKYLRRLMKLNSQKLKDLENMTNKEVKEVKLSEDKYCQTDSNDDEEVTSMCASREFTTGGTSSDTDTLMSEMFYLPTHPDLPDLQLFKLL